MAGQTRGTFKVKLSPFLREKYAALTQAPESEQSALKAIELQYLFDQREHSISNSEKRRHYEATVEQAFEGAPLRGVERLYRRSIVIAPTMVCAAHCRWCIRGQYPTYHLGEDELLRIARYCGSAEETKELQEVLITGGDPLMNVRQLRYLVEALVHYAPQVRIFRVASRVPLQQPSRIDADTLSFFSEYRERVELALHLNHAAELFPEVRTAIAAIGEAGVRIYNQSVLLRCLNDSVEELECLCDELRRLRIEFHYLFHCVPIRGMAHHRTTLAQGLKLASRLTASGRFSGRAKPNFTLMTDIGKITPYEGTILARDGCMVLLQSHYDYQERLRVNPNWRLPASAAVDEEGLLTVWYEDAVPQKMIVAEAPTKARAV